VTVRMRKRHSSVESAGGRRPFPRKGFERKRASIFRNS
jgi:hypothetical protein